MPSAAIPIVKKSGHYSVFLFHLINCHLLGSAQRIAGVLLLALAAIATTGCQLGQTTPAEHAAILGSLRHFQSAVNHRSFAELSPILAPTFQIGDLPSEMSVAGLRYSIQTLSVQIQDVQILSIRRSGNAKEVLVGLYQPNCASELRIVFTPDGKIQALKGNSSSTRARVSAPDFMVSHFIDSGGLMFVQATANGKTGYFLIDSGSSEMLLNERYFGATAAGGLLSVSSGIHGVRQVLGSARIDAFRWGGFRATDVDAELADLSNLEGSKNTPLLGAIGYAQLHDCALVVDWPHHQLQVCATTSNGSRKVADSSPPKATMPFTYYLYLPVLPAKIGGQTFSMLLDSGASTNMLPGLQGLDGHFLLQGTRANLSDGGPNRSVTAAFGTIDEVRFGSISIRNMPIIIYDVPYFPGKGLVGSSLLQHGRVEINFRAHQLRFWE